MEQTHLFNNSAIHSKALPKIASDFTDNIRVFINRQRQLIEKSAPFNKTRNFFQKRSYLK